MHPFRLIIVVVLLLVGLVWLGQGLGFIGGSFMSSQPAWAVIGVILVAGAAFLAWTGRGRAPAR